MSQPNSKPSERANEQDVHDLMRSYGKMPANDRQKMILLNLEKERGDFVKERQFQARRETSRQKEILHPRERGHGRGR